MKKTTKKKVKKNLLISGGILAILILLGIVFYFQVEQTSFIDDKMQIEKKIFKKISETDKSITYKLSFELTQPYHDRTCQNRKKYPFVLKISSHSEGYNNKEGSIAIQSFSQVQNDVVTAKKVQMPSFTGVKNACAEPYIKERFPFDTSTERAECYIFKNKLNCDWMVNVSEESEDSSFGGIESSGRKFSTEVTFLKKGIECLSDKDCGENEECIGNFCIEMEQTSVENDTEELIDDTQNLISEPENDSEQLPPLETTGEEQESQLEKEGKVETFGNVTFGIIAFAIVGGTALLIWMNTKRKNKKSKRSKKKK